MAKILIVDDDCDSRDVLREYLTAYGHSVECVGDGQAAVASVISDLADVIVLDLHMPGMDGADFLQVLRSYSRIRRTPVIIWTGAPDGPLLARAGKLGIHAVCVKSHTPLSEIRLIIEQASPPNPDQPQAWRPGPPEF